MQPEHQNCLVGCFAAMVLGPLLVLFPFHLQEKGAEAGRLEGTIEVRAQARKIAERRQSALADLQHELKTARAELNRRRVAELGPLKKARHKRQVECRRLSATFKKTHAAKLPADLLLADGLTLGDIIARLAERTIGDHQYPNRKTPWEGSFAMKSKEFKDRLGVLSNMHLRPKAVGPIAAIVTPGRTGYIVTLTLPDHLPPGRRETVVERVKAWRLLCEPEWVQGIILTKPAGGFLPAPLDLDRLWTVLLLGYGKPQTMPTWDELDAKLGHLALVEVENDSTHRIECTFSSPGGGGAVHQLQPFETLQFTLPPGHYRVSVRSQTDSDVEAYYEMFEQPYDAGSIHPHHFSIKRGWRNPRANLPPLFPGRRR